MGPCDNTPGDQLLQLSDPGWPPRASWPQYHLCQQLSPDLLILQLLTWCRPPWEITWIWKCVLLKLINISLFSSSCNCHSDSVIFLQNIDTIQTEATADTNTCDPQPSIYYTTMAKLDIEEKFKKDISKEVANLKEFLISQGKEIVKLKQENKVKHHKVHLELF